MQHKPVQFVLAAALATLAMGSASATSTVRLPDTPCGGSDSIFADGLETAGMYPANPSQGSGGAWPGNQARNFQSPGYGNQTYYLYIPPQYQPGQPMPLMVVLEGTAGSHAAAMQRAQQLRDNWSDAADNYGFIIAAPVSNGSQGGWLVPGDYGNLALMLADVKQAYNIERNRISLWGYSAGGHIAWDMLLNFDVYSAPTPFNADNLASFSTSAANSGFACEYQVSTCNAAFSHLPRRVPVDIHIGTSDPNHAWAADDYQRLLAHGWQDAVNLSYNPFNGGHTYTFAQLEQVAAFACRYAAVP